jgi:hypothetical protein
MLRRRRQTQGRIEVLGEKSPAATVPPTQSGGAGRVPVDGGEVVYEAACGDDAEVDRIMVGDDAELDETASALTASPAPQQRSSRFRGVSWDASSSKWRT